MLEYYSWHKGVKGNLLSLGGSKLFKAAHLLVDL